MRDLGGLLTPSGTLRAQSETLGLILVFGMVIAGATTVVVFGASAISDSQDTLETQRAEKVMTQLDSKAALVALDNTDVSSVSFSRRGDGSYGVNPGTGWMNITITDRATGNTDRDFVNQSLGAITYENGNDRIAYQGGGVWRTTRDGGSVMVSPPEFHFRNGTLTLPILNVTGDRHLGSRASIAHEKTTRMFPNTSIDSAYSNPLPNHKVDVVVKSDYYEAWGNYFEERTDGDVRYIHDEQKAILTLKVPFGNANVNNAIAATSGSGVLDMDGTGSRYTDNYTSADGDGYAGDDHDSGTVMISGDILMGGNSEIRGSAVSGGTIETNSNSVWIEKDANYTDDPAPDASRVGGDVNEIDGVQGPSAITSVVRAKVDEFADDNRNGDNGAIDPTTDTLNGGDQTISAPGNYYLESLVVSGDTLTLDTSSGDIFIGVEENVLLEGTSGGVGRIKVQGDHQARIYVKGEGTDPDFKLHKVNGNPAEVEVAEHENSTKFWMLGGREFDAVIHGDSSNPYKFEGVIYAPGDSSSVWVEKAQVFGGIVIGDVTLENGAEIHYDSALEKRSALAPNTKIVKITYLHVTINEISVSGN